MVCFPRKNTLFRFRRRKDLSRLSFRFEHFEQNCQSGSFLPSVDEAFKFAFAQRTQLADPDQIPLGQVRSIPNIILVFHLWSLRSGSLNWSPKNLLKPFARKLGMKRIERLSVFFFEFDHRSVVMIGRSHLNTMVEARWRFIQPVEPLIYQWLINMEMLWLWHQPSTHSESPSIRSQTFLETYPTWVRNNRIWTVKYYRKIIYLQNDQTSIISCQIALRSYWELFQRDHRWYFSQVQHRWNYFFGIVSVRWSWVNIRASSTTMN